jgi:hypothetical protein
MGGRSPNGTLNHGHSRGEARSLYNEVFNEQVYPRNGIEPRDGDVGANIGLFSLFLGEILRNEASHAFEFIYDSFEYIRRGARRIEEKIRFQGAGGSQSGGGRSGEAPIASSPALLTGKGSIAMRREPFSTLFPDSATTLAAVPPGSQYPTLDRSNFHGHTHFVVSFSQRRRDFCAHVNYFVYSLQRRSDGGSVRRTAPFGGVRKLDVPSQQSEPARGSRPGYATRGVC